MTRIRPTHHLSSTGETPVSCSGDGDCPGNTTCDPETGQCVDAYETPITEPTDIIGGKAGDSIPVRFHPQGANIDLGIARTATGEDVQRSPVIEAQGDLSGVLSEGNTIALEAIVDGHDDYDDLEARAVLEIYGAQRSRPQKTLIETEEH
ncbi:hypothetical protein [Natrinema soli]|uniref:Uncharacterized protein n=1 Tax=Natrinema soli TaxID=1930624 RepID=A0ABD5SQL6_9EURY|nr:hypothetical protein [Natrinema soli]